jgi:hypothetical protein
MKGLFITFLFSLIGASYSVVYNVKTASDLQNALSKAAAGDQINLEDGTYKGMFKCLSKSGTSSNRITLSGQRGAVLTNSGNGTGLLFEKCNYWLVKGFTISKFQKGIMTKSSNNNIFENLDVNNIGDEAVHFKLNSCDNTIRQSTISYTGLSEPGYGEGVYIGSALRNWEKNTPDRSNRNKVLSNSFGPNIAAEAIDIKEGTRDGLIDGNKFNGKGMSGANYAKSWLQVKGSNYVISNNSGSWSLSDGFQVSFIDYRVITRNNVLSGLITSLKPIECYKTNLKRLKLTAWHSV